ncbi:MULTISPECIES: DUF2309 domain-containing protein [Haloarcula]|uniref:DUF2309 domain-containing protein n=1 Tax=Haloarcula TaxID=2237 RepID=UPI0023ECD1AE|nr:DUF2309 domain-containing protein [Halomicroarcula sp. XH51]
MTTETTIRDSIDKAATIVGSVWPIHSFVTANPLSGFEDLPFDQAVTQAADLLGGRGYPRPETYRAALEDGQIDPGILEAELAERGFEADPETLLGRMDTDVEHDAPDTATERVDHVLTKWLAAFLDEGRAEWEMPNGEAGFYVAFRTVAEHDGDIPDEGIVGNLPDTPLAALETLLEPYPESQWVPIFEEQLAALPGWTGFVKQRAEDGEDWQSASPITLAGYLAARLSLYDAFDVDVEPSTGPDSADAYAVDELADAFLTAWEASYRNDVVEHVADGSESLAERGSSGRPDAQLVFCIDTRSEVIRRHVEAAGDYETHGYAGFFGIPMEYQGYDADVAVDACPPILEPQHRISEVPTDDDRRASHAKWTSLREAARSIIKALKTNPATAFGFVEHAGSGYGLALAARTLVPGRVADLFDAADAVPDEHAFCDQTVHHQHTYAGDLPVGLTHEEQVEYAATAFELMGWEAFGRLVVVTGHASETANNPYDASLDCGACAGNPGGPNARVLASICNDPDVQASLRERGIDVPEDTVFLAGEHNTTTDEVDLFDGHVPESHADELEQLRADLATARANATAERAASMGADATTGLSETERRAADWAESRPEWGLAGNAGFVVGPRELTRDLDLDGRSFLHSYDWSTDPEGDALEAILTGPMVVTQWINAQYYFSTVDNAVYGSGSKVTHNPVGNVGVYQGNGGDLMTGLPFESLMAADGDPYHQPLRLSTVVHAPVERTTEVLADHDGLTELLDNDWLSLTVVDPTRDHRAFHYEADLEWTPVAGESEVPSAEASAPTVADD